MQARGTRVVSTAALEQYVGGGWIPGDAGIGGSVEVVEAGGGSAWEPASRLAKMNKTYL